MHVGDILVAQGLLTKEELKDGLLWQQHRGGSLVDCLVSLGKIEQSALEDALRTAPKSPGCLAETGLSTSSLLSLMMKSMSLSGEATITGLAEELKLPPRAMQELFDEAENRQLLNVLGGSHQSGEIRYTLTQKGVERAKEALAQNEYVGPAPVPLAAFREQISRQKIAGERIDRATIQRAFDDLVVPDHLVRELGPALNSGRSILLYGEPGNGKTTIGERVAQLYSDVIYIPYCFEVEGQIIKLFDPTVHHAIDSHIDENGGLTALRREQLDTRWVACRRPCVITGGELTLEMLDLSFDPQVRFYEAPLHIKALCGVFLIDDFGRQIVSPTALLNRWIVPLGSGVDYLKLHTGKSFSLPFDELVIFSTNMPPQDLMDAAFLRRIPYKIEVGAPTVEEYRKIFLGIAGNVGLEADSVLVDVIISRLRETYQMPLASYQPYFIIQQILASAKFDGISPKVNPDYMTMALNNLVTRQATVERDNLGVSLVDSEVTVLNTPRPPSTQRFMLA